LLGDTACEDLERALATNVPIDQGAARCFGAFCP
jgi:hypothetical protein